MPTSFDPERVLCLPLMANLATTSTDGPRNAPVWFLWDDGVLSMLGSSDSRSVQRIEADPRCAVEIVDYDNAEGRLLHLGLRGKATVTEMDPALFKRLLRKYLDADEANWNRWFIKTVARIDDPEGRLIRLQPDGIFTNNVSYFRTGPKLAT